MQEVDIMRIAVCDDQELFVNEISEKIKEHLDSQNYNYHGRKSSDIV